MCASVLSLTMLLRVFLMVSESLTSLHAVQSPEHAVWELGATGDIPQLRALDPVISVCLCRPVILAPSHWPGPAPIVTTPLSSSVRAMDRRSSQAKPRLVFNCNCKVSRRLGTQQSFPTVAS